MIAITVPDEGLDHVLGALGGCRARVKWRTMTVGRIVDVSRERTEPMLLVDDGVDLWGQLIPISEIEAMEILETPRPTSIADKQQIINQMRAIVTNSYW